MQLIIQYGIDILLLLVLFSSIIVSVRKGFLKCILSLLCAVVALVAASSFSEPISEWCYDNIVSDIVVSNIENELDEGLGVVSFDSAVQTAVESLPEFITVSLDNLGIDINDITGRIDKVELSTENTAQVISDEIIRPGAIVLLRFIAFLTIYLVVRFLSGFVSGIISKVAKLPVLKQANKMLGAILGLIKGVVSVFVVSIFFNFLSEMLKNTNVLTQAIENSRICDIIIELIK